MWKIVQSIKSCWWVIFLIEWLIMIKWIIDWSILINLLIECCSIDTLRTRYTKMNVNCMKFILHSLYVASLGLPLSWPMKVATTKGNQETTRAKNAGWIRPFNVFVKNIYCHSIILTVITAVCYSMLITRLSTWRIIVVLLLCRDIDSELRANKRSSDYSGRVGNRHLYSAWSTLV